MCLRDIFLPWRLWEAATVLLYSQAGPGLVYWGVVGITALPGATSAQENRLGMQLTGCGGNQGGCSGVV